MAMPWSMVAPLPAKVTEIPVVLSAPRVPAVARPVTESHTGTVVWSSAKVVVGAPEATLMVEVLGVKVTVPFVKLRGTEAGVGTRG